MANMKSITVKALRELLEDQDDDLQVIFSVDYGDYHHTKQALPLRGDTEEVMIEKSAYSHSGFALADEDDEDDVEDRKYEPYLLIK